MQFIKGHFDELGFWDKAYFENPIFESEKIIIPTRNIEVYKEHPLNNIGQTIILPKGRLIFNDIKKSERIIGEYLGDPKSGADLKPAYKVVDGPSAHINKPVTKFILEGILEEPLSYVTWFIESVLFTLEI